MFALVFLTGVAFADVRAADDLAKAVTEVMSKTPPLRCSLFVDTSGSDGKTTENQREEFALTFENNKQIETRVHMWRDGKALTPEEMKKEDARHSKKPTDRNHIDIDDDTQPFSTKGLARHDFTVLRDEALWGHQTHVVQVSARPHESTAVNGIAWIDVATKIPLKMELEPAKLSSTIERMHILIQYLPSLSGAPLPSLFKLDGAIKFFWKRATFSHTMTWTDCR